MKYKCTILIAGWIFFQHIVYILVKKTCPKEPTMISIHLVKLDSCFQDLSMLCAKYQSSGIAGSQEDF
jgi:hypothetical protein